jgi:L-iditol 2-dehydrogenase
MLGSRFGATATFAVASSDAPAAVLAATSGKGGDVVIQCAGTVAATAMALQLVADRGRVLIEGYAASSETIPISPDQFAVRELRLRGVRGWTASQFQSTLKLHEGGAIELKPLVTDCFSLADYEQALARSLDYGGGAIKVCFAIGTAEGTSG